MSQTFTSDIVHLNVGGTRFSTSRQTLTSIQDSFFTSMLSGRIPTCRDETGSLFIDRDPKLFSIILNFLRTKELDLNGVDASVLRHEAEFYGVTPLAKRLLLCEDLERSMCGDVLFTGFIAAPTHSHPINLSTASNLNSQSTNMNNSNNNSQMITINKSITKPGNVMRLTPHSATTTTHSRNSSMDFMTVNKTHSRKSSYETLSFIPQQHHASHSRNQSFDLKQMKNDLGTLLGSNIGLGVSNAQMTNRDLNVYQVNLIVGHLNWIAVAHNHFVSCYKMKDGMGWQLIFQSPHIDEDIDRIALNSKHQSTTASSSTTQLPTIPQSPPSSSTHLMSGSMNNQQLSSGGIVGSLSAAAATATTQPDIPGSKMSTVLAIAFETSIRLWMINDENMSHLIGTFSLGASVDYLFFIGSQLVALRCSGKIGVWNSLTQLWQIQDVTPIASYDTAGSVLLLGGQNGVIYYIDMQKFPLRIKDNDLLVTELYKDASCDAITALSVYLTPKTSNTGNWIEIAYGTSSGTVRVVVQHPETVGHGPQLFQTFNVHRSSVVKVMLTEKYLISVCSEYNHVRTWTVTRFRGMISTQPGSTPLASFKIVSIDAIDSPNSYLIGNNIGPYGEREDQQVFIQKVVPFTDQLFVRLSSTGKRICTIKSVDYAPITCFCVHECEGPSRLNSRPRRYLFTGHSNGTIQMWDLTTALELKPCDQTCLGGPTASEFVRLLDQCDLATSTNSGYSTPNTTSCLSPCPSVCSLNPRVLPTKSLFISSHQQSTILNSSDNQEANKQTLPQIHNL